MLAGTAAVTRPAATARVAPFPPLFINVNSSEKNKMGQRLSKAKKRSTTTTTATSSAASSPTSSSKDDGGGAADDVSSSSTTRVLTSVDLSRWIASRGSTAELIRCHGSETPDVASSAAALGVDVSCIVKSLVFACDGECIVVVTNGVERVDAKKLARRLGLANKRVRLATPAEAIAECGYAPGTVPPFGHRCDFMRVFVDEKVPLVPGGVVWGGGGDIDMEVKVDVDELLRLTEGELLDVKQNPKKEKNERAEMKLTVAATTTATTGAGVATCIRELEQPCSAVGNE